MKKTFILLAFFLLLISGVSATWCNSTYARRNHFNITNIQASVTTEFFLNITYDSDMLGNGNDLIFYDDSCNQIPAHLENIDTSGNFITWIHKTFVTGNDVVWVYYKKPTATGSWSASGVWNSTYKLVMYLNDTDDYSTNPKTATFNGATSTTVGVVDGGYSFDGTNDYIALSNNESWRTLPLTIELLLNFRQAASNKGEDEKIIDFMFLVLVS